MSGAVSPVKGGDTPVSMGPLHVQTKPGSHLADPAPLAMGGFATTLLSVSLAMMHFRGVSDQTMFVGDLCFVAGIGLLISAQWEMVRGNTFSYTVLSAYAFYYAGYGALMIPGFGIISAYGGYTPEYYNALGFFELLWGVFNLFFFIASLSVNFVYISIFASLELCLVLDAASNFCMGNGNAQLHSNLITASGAWAFIASLLGYYCVAHYLCEDSLPFRVPMGDTSRFFKRLVKSKVGSNKKSDEFV